MALCNLETVVNDILFDIALELANSPTATEKTWLKRVRSLPAKGTWVAPNVAKIPNIKDWVMDSNTADIIIFWIHGRDHTAHADVQHILIKLLIAIYLTGGGFVFGYDTMYAPAVIQLVKQLTNEHKKNVRLFSLEYGE